MVEANPDLVKEIRSKDRHAALLPNCLATGRTPQTVEFDASSAWGGIINEGRILPGNIDWPEDKVNLPRKYNRRTITVQCFPLYSVLMAMGNPTVDYFSLDIEGAEFPVLKSIPFDKVLQK